LENGTNVAWEGRFGEADLKVEIPPSGRIHVEWTTAQGTRNKVVDSIEQLERSVLFQLMVGKDVPDEAREEVADAVAITLANRLEMPVQARQSQQRPRKKSQSNNQRGRGGGPPRRRGGGGRRGGRRRR